MNPQDASAASARNEAEPTRMHAVSAETTDLVDLVLDYSRRRMLARDTPLDKPISEFELDRLAGRAIGEAGIGAARALSLFEHVLAPACITTDHPQYLSFIPTAPTKAATAFDLVVSASAVYGGSWLEGAGAVYAENEVLAWLAGEFGLPAAAGGVFVQGGTLGNLSALVAAREHARFTLRTAGTDAPGRWKVVCSAEAHSSIASAARVMDVDVVPHSRSTGHPCSPSSPPPARPTSASSTTSPRSPPSRRSSTSGCTSTAPTGSRRCSRRSRDTVSRAWSGPTR